MGASAVKSKLDETGVSDAALKAKNAVVSNAKYAGGAINEKIEANPTLSNLKRQSTAKMGAAAAYVGSWVAWGAGNANAEEAKDDGKDAGNDDSFEESKEEEQPQEERANDQIVEEKPEADN